MKTSYYLLTIFSLLIISCTSNQEDNGNTEVSEETLRAIAKKLNNLEANFIDFESDNISKKSSLKHKKLNKIKTEDCVHQINENSSDSQGSYQMSIKFFDKNGNEVTNCDIYEMNEFPIRYGVEVYTYFSADSVSFEINQYINYETAITITSLSTATLTEFANFELEAEMDIFGDLFYFLEGSYINLYSSSDLELSSENEIESSSDASETIEFKFLISFPVEDKEYHFDLFIDEMNISDLDNSLELNYEYDLLNSSNEKIATIKFELETYDIKLYDLGGNFVE